MSCVAYALHTVVAVVQSLKSGGNAGAAALTWPFYRVRSQAVPRSDLDVPTSLLVAVVELAFTAWVFVAINSWFAARYDGLVFGALTIGAIAVAAVPVLLLSWLVSGLFLLLFEVLFKVLTA
jgi:hypothetical protein